MFSQQSTLGLYHQLEIPVSKPQVVESMISTISLRSTSDHVLDEVTMSRSINDSAREEIDNDAVEDNLST